MFHSINRQTETQKGTGLPFYIALSYQERFSETFTSGSPLGFWLVPNNQLPTFQIWANKSGALSLASITVVPTNGTTDGTGIVLDNSNLDAVCVGEGLTDEYLVLTCKEQDRSFALDCGTHYIDVELSNGDHYYSEVFMVGGVCSLAYDLDFTADAVNVDLSVDTTMVVSLMGTGVIGFTVTIGVDTFTTTPFNYTFPNGTTSLTLSVETENCGTYQQTYEFVNNAGITFALNKTY